MKRSSGAESLPDCVTTLEQLEALYDAPVPRSLIKEIDSISEHYRAFIEKAPFVVVATVGPEGLDCSPRGDPPGFVRVMDEKTLLLPDDSLRNLVRDPRISLLFLIPGIGETLRVNGRAEILVDPELCADFALQGKVPSARRPWRGPACGTRRHGSHARSCRAPARSWNPSRTRRSTAPPTTAAIPIT
jgi:predicted pyridoxine 5'-phosphate oxidase superfamily flavin-nucleotide-binding protein